MAPTQDATATYIVLYMSGGVLALAALTCEPSVAQV